MVNLSDAEYVKGLKSNLHVTFESPQGQEVMKFIEVIGGWYPSILDPSDTNSIIARDANRRLIGTIKSVMNLTPEQIVSLAGQKDAQ